MDTKRASTLEGLYAAGDVAGGGPQKYVTGSFAEGEIAAMSALEYIKGKDHTATNKQGVEQKLQETNGYLENGQTLYSIEDIEDAMQKIMDDYAGGISSGYVVNAQKLDIAGKRINELLELGRTLKAKDLHELMFIYEVIDRLYVCKVLIEHLKARKETRWHSFHEYADYPLKDDANWLKYVNSRYEDGKVKIIFRDLVKKGEVYEHKD